MGMGIASSSRLPLPSLLFSSACSPGLQHTRVVRARADRVVRLAGAVRCSDGTPSRALRTCKNCKQQFDPTLNHARACRFHTAHFGGETKRKFESVYTGGTMNTPDSGRVFQYWHCCGSEDPFDAGCTAAPHCSYDE